MSPISTGNNIEPALANGTGDTIADADGLLGIARGIEDQEAVEVVAPPIEADYNAALVEVVEEKQEQAGRIEDRIENMIEAQSARLQQVQAHPPGALSLPGTRAKWQAQIAQAQATVQQLHNRLETVREIKDGISVHGSRIEVMAAQKLENREPKLAEEFAEMQAARRLHELHTREQQEKKRQERQGVVQEAGRTNGLSLSRGL